MYVHGGDKYHSPTPLFVAPPTIVATPTRILAHFLDFLHRSIKNWPSGFQTDEAFVGVALVLWA